MRKLNYPITASTGAVTAYIPVDAAHTVVGGYAVVNSATCNAATTVKFKSGSTVLGTATIASGATVGTVAAFVMDTTLATRKTNITAAIPLTVLTGGDQSSSTGFDVFVHLDDLACPRD